MTASLILPATPAPGGRRRIQGEVGIGYAVLAELERGEHEITVSAPDGIGRVVSERAIIVVGGRPQHRIG